MHTESNNKSPDASNNDDGALSETTLLRHFDSPEHPKSPCTRQGIIKNAMVPLKLSEYKTVTSSMFNQLNWIKSKIEKDYSSLPMDQRIDFTFKKPGFKKLLIFDLDETLVHVKRDAEDLGAVQDQKYDEGFEPEVEIEVVDQNNQIQKASFSIRPYARNCLQFANEYFEVAIFTAG